MPARHALFPQTRPAQHRDAARRRINHDCEAAPSRFGSLGEGLLNRLDTRCALELLPPFAQMFSTTLPMPAPPVFCAFGIDAVDELVGWFRAAGIATGICPSLPDLEILLYHDQRSLPFVMLNGDAQGGMEANLWFLLQIRRDFPQMVVVLCSQAFRGNDFGTDRLPLADICVKTPFCLSLAEEYFHIAFDNNRAWQQRMSGASR